LFNHFSLDRHLNHRDTFKKNRSVALAEWRQGPAARGRVPCGRFGSTVPALVPNGIGRARYMGARAGGSAFGVR
jgi:hypothetical protein